MNIFAELAKKYSSINVRLKFMAQVAAGIGRFAGIAGTRQRILFLQFYADLWAMLDMLVDVGVMTFREACEAKDALEAYYDRNFSRIAEVRGHE